LNLFSTILAGAALIGASFIPGLNVGVWATIAGGAAAAGATTFASLAFGAGAALLLGGASAALSEVKTPSIRAKASKRSIRAAKAYERVIYGKARVGGQIAWVWSGYHDKKVLVGVHVIAAHVCQSLEAVWVNGKRLELETNGTTVGLWADTDLIPVEGSGFHRVMGIAFHDGTQTTADSWLVDAVDDADVWGSSHIGRGYCYVRVALRFDAQFEASGVPDLSFEIKGKKVYDPRTDSTAWSDNPALCAVDWMRSEWAARMPLDRFDTDLIEAAADDCDELIALEAGGTIKRYTCSLAIEVTLPWRDVLQALTDSMAGRMVRSGTIMEIYAGVPQSSEWSLVEDDLAGPISWTMDRPIGELANIVKGEFQDRAKNWNDAETVEVGDAGFLAEDNGVPYVQSIDLPAVDRADQAQRLAKIRLRSLRQQNELSLILTYAAGMQIKCWSVGTVTLPRYAMDAKTFRCLEWSFVPIGEGDGLGVRVRLRETSSTIFDWTASEEGDTVVPGATTANDPLEQVADLPTLTLANLALKNPSGTSVPSIRATWTLPTTDPGSLVEFRYRTTQRGFLREDGTLAKANGKSNNRGIAAVSGYTSLVVPAGQLSAQISPVHLAYLYEVSARMQNAAGFTSTNWTVATIWTESDGTVAEAIYNLTARQVGVDDVELKWKLPRSRDVRSVEVWGSRTESLDDAKLLADDVRGQKATIHKLSSGSIWWLVRYRRQDGAVSPWNVGGAVRVDVSATFGKLAKLDKVGIDDITNGVVTRSQQQKEVEKLNVGGAMAEQIFLLVNVPSGDGITTVSVQLMWSFWIGGGQPATRIVNRIRVDGVIVDEDRNHNIENKPVTISDFTYVSMQPGTRRVSMEMQTVGGNSKVQDIKLAALVNIR
jgi:hypothetical protein